MMPLHIFKFFHPARQCLNWPNIAREFSSASFVNSARAFATLSSFTSEDLRFQRSRLFNTPSSSVEKLSCRSLHTSTKRMMQLQFPKEAVAQMLSNIKDVKSSPSAPLVLGIVGVLPFVASPLYFFMGGYYDLQIAYSQIAYGAAILSFMGGVRWGFTLPDNSALSPSYTNLCYSIVPPLAAWISLLFPLPLATLTIAAGLGGTALYDNILPGYPPWFKALRTLLTLIAISSLVVSLLCCGVLEHDEVTTKNKKA